MHCFNIFSTKFKNNPFVYLAVGRKNTAGNILVSFRNRNEIFEIHCDENSI